MWVFLYQNRFLMKKINESFTCRSCSREITKAPRTCRNHCPYCFASSHVDWKMPWDRSSECGGLMIPTMYELKNWWYKLLFVCTVCRKKHRNKACDDDDLWSLEEAISSRKSKYLDVFEWT